MFLNLHTHSESDDNNVIEIVNQYPFEFNADVKMFSIGIHPWHINKVNIDAEMGIINIISQTEKCVAIGECGLDKRIEIPFHLQEEVFEMQLDLAQKSNMPVIIHCVSAYNEVIAIKNRMKVTVPLIIHGFSKNLEISKQLLDHGFYLSFGKYLLRNPELKDVFKAVPDDRLFLETDTIEESISDVYNRASEYKNITIDELQNITQNNFKTVFRNGRMD